MASQGEVVREKTDREDTDVLGEKISPRASVTESIRLISMRQS